MDVAEINFSELEKDEYFRSDMLCFIRMANHYISTIFWDVFTKNSKKRREELYKVAQEKLKNENKNEQFLLDAIVPNKGANGKRGSEVMDCISGNFANKILEELAKDKQIEKVFQEKLRINYAIFGVNGKDNFAVFRDAIFALYKRRNLLEHYNDPADINKKGSNTNAEKYNKNCRKDWKNNGNKVGEPVHTDVKVMEALGLFLLPELLHNFVGRVRHYEEKLDVVKSKSQAEAIRKIIGECVKNRRNSNKLLFSEERTKKQIKDKNRRKNLVGDNIPWKKAYNDFSAGRGKQTDYKLHEFKFRYYFIGENNIAKIRNLLGKENSLHFKYDIEAFYLLTMQINLIIHRSFHNIKIDMSHSDIDDELLKKIRDTIAHNGLFWSVKYDRLEDKSNVCDVKDVFTVIFKICYYCGGKDEINYFYTRIAALLKNQKFSLVEINEDHPKILHIKQWTKKNREKYLRNNGNNIKIDRRRYYQGQVAKWKRALDEAKKEVEIL